MPDSDPLPTDAGTLPLTPSAFLEALAARGGRRPGAAPRRAGEDRGRQDYGGFISARIRDPRTTDASRVGWGSGGFIWTAWSAWPLFCEPRTAVGFVTRSHWWRQRPLAGGIPPDSQAAGCRGGPDGRRPTCPERGSIH